MFTYYFSDTRYPECFCPESTTQASVSLCDLHPLCSSVTGPTAVMSGQGSGGGAFWERKFYDVTGGR